VTTGYIMYYIVLYKPGLYTLYMGAKFHSEVANKVFFLNV